MIKITDISQVLYYIDGVDAVIFDLDDTLCLEKEYVSSGYDAVAKILPQIKNVKKKLWNYFLNRRAFERRRHIFRRTARKVFAGVQTARSTTEFYQRRLRSIKSNKRKRS